MALGWELLGPAESPSVALARLLSSWVPDEVPSCRPSTYIETIGQPGAAQAALLGAAGGRPDAARCE